MNFTNKTVSTGGASLAVTIPSELVKIFEINPGDFVTLDLVKVTKK